MKMKRYIYITALFFCFLSLPSCKGWLSVDSDDRILEEKLFGSTDGFYTALNGVYIDFVNAGLYSGKLTASVPDVLAQYYDTSVDSHNYGSLAQFQTEAKRLAVADMWSRTYYLILNINKIIEHCDAKKGTVLNGSDYNLIKGESLALRALLHFEMFRYFGPIYRSAPGAASIPYVTDASPRVNPILKANEAAPLILADLDASMSLLKASDPVIRTGKNDVDNGGRNLYNFRNLRMNYFAVKALAARVNMYLGETRSKDYRADALRLAEEVINEASAFFPFSTREEVLGAINGSAVSSMEDRVLSSDILFSVYNVKRGADIYEKLFANTLEIKQLLAMTEQGFNALYPDSGDLRRYQWQRKNNAINKPIMCFVKYEAMEVDGKIYPYMIPVLRMSEMYLIAAECHAIAAEADTDKALARLNELRRARMTSSVMGATADEIVKNVESEYRREFVGEGQLFWYYKRNWRTSIPVLYDENKGNVQMPDANFVFELPQSEDGYRK